MSKAGALIDIPSLIRYESQRQSNCLITRHRLPEYYYPSYLRHPNRPISPSFSPHLSPSFPPHLSPHLSPSSSSLSSYDQETDITHESSAVISVDGELDTRIDIIQPGDEKGQVSYPSYVCAFASAPPFSDDEIEYENSYHNQQQQRQQQQKEEEECVCVICYETFEDRVELNRGRNYTSEELEDIEGKEKISDFCQTCKYNVHHKCIDEYRLNKMTDIIRNGYQVGRIHSPSIAGIFGIKCLMCAKEVEKIHVSSDGDINIVKTQGADANSSEQNRGQQQSQQQQIEEVIQNRIQRRFRRRQRIQFCKNKICSICFMFLVAVVLLVFLFRAI